MHLPKGQSEKVKIAKWLEAPTAKSQKWKVMTGHHLQSEEVKSEKCKVKAVKLQEDTNFQKCKV